jgi:hypothetical protein
VVKPETVIVPEVDCETEPVIPPGLDTAVYEEIVAPGTLPPPEIRAVYVTVAVVDPVAVAVPIVGASGTVKYAMTSQATEIDE